MSKIIGIDLGTTNSLAACWKNGAVQLIPNAFGEYLTPSVISVDGDTIYVGKVAKERLITHPEQTVSVFKRSMGTTRRWELGGKTYLPEELSALVLRRLKEDAESYLGEPVEEAIISVPAYFGDQARKATRDAGELAGLKVERILNEPSAAALACIVDHPQDEAKYMVFDFGGGTLDVSLVQCFENVVEIQAVSGNNRLGGSDFDQVIAREFCKQNHWDYVNLEPSLKQNLLRSAEQAKIALTGAEYAMMVVTTEQQQHSMGISRKELIRIIAPALQKLAEPVNCVLRDGKVSPAELDAVIMVGGSSKMPIVQQYLKFLLKGGAKLRVVNPDQMIARGVGIYAGIRERSIEVQDLVMTDLCPFSLGTGIQNPADPGNDLMSVIIPRNNMLPITRKNGYCTVADGQTKLKISIYQGEELYVKDNTLLGALEMTVPAGPKGQESVQVAFTYDINGLLIVNCTVESTGEKKTLTLFQGKVTQNHELLKRARELSQLTMSDAADEANRLLIERGKRVFSQLGNDRKKRVQEAVIAFQKAVDTADPYQIFKARGMLTALLEQMEQTFIDHQVEEGSIESFEEWLNSEESSDDDDYWGSLFNSEDPDF